MKKQETNNSLLYSLPFQGKEAARGFTLVELIVVITILAILGTIAFISLQGYSVSSRDSVRISDVSNMKTSLELFHLDAGKYPLPDDFVIVDYNTEPLRYQGTFGSDVVSQLSRNISEIPTDSLSNKEYIYSVANNKNEFEILNLLEGDLAYSPHLTSPKERGIATLVSQTNAAGTTTRLPRIDGQYNGVFIKTAGYIVPTPSIITSEDTTGGLTLNADNIKSQVTTLGANIPNIGNINSATGKLNITLSVYNGTINKDSLDSAKALVMQKIQAAYTGSELVTSDIYAYILSKTTPEDLVALTDTVVLKTNTTSAAIIPTNCEFNGEPVSNSISVTAYESSTVSYGNTCISEQRLCSDGVLDGTYTYSECTPDLTPTFLSNCTTNGQIYYADNTGNKLASVTNAGDATWVSGKSISDLTCSGHIIVCNGNNSGYTLQACNVGATVVGATNTSGAYGNYFQWGNNGGTPSGTITPSTIFVNTISPVIYGPGNYYNNTTFIGGASLIAPYDWSSPQNNNLWGSGGTVFQRQGPCSVGYHISTNIEWDAINVIGGWCKNGCGGSDDLGTGLSNSIKLPWAGFRYGTTGIMADLGTDASYWSSSPSGTNAYQFRFNSYRVYSFISSNRVNAYPIRCFKN